MTRTFALALTALVLVTGTAGADDTRRDWRSDRQQERIDQGIASGEVTNREAARLNAQQYRIDRRINRAEADGTVTTREKVGIERAQNRASRNIWRQKHDAQTR